MNLKEAFKIVSKVFFSDISTKVVSSVSFLYFTRTLGPERFGSFLLFQSLLSVLALLTDAGIGGAVRKRLSEGRENVFVTGVLVKIPLILMGIIIVMIFIKHINEFIGADFGILLVPGILILTVGQHLIVAMEGLQRVGTAASARLLQRIVFSVLGLFLVSRSVSAEALVVALLASWVIVTIYLSPKINAWGGTVSLETAKSIISFAKFNFLTLSGGKVYNWTDTIIIGLFLDESAVTIYEVAWRVSQVTTVLSTSIGRTLLPEVSKADATGTIEEMEELIPGAITASLLLPVPAFFGALVLGGSLLTYTFGPAYTGAIIPLLVLIFGRMFEAVRDVISRVAFGVDSPSIVAKSTLLFIVMNLSLNAVFVQAFGLVGAAVATVLSFAVRTFVLWHYSKHSALLGVNWSKVGTIILSSVGMYVAIRYVLRLITIDNPISLVTVILIGGIIYIGLLVIPQSSRDLLRIVAER